MPRKPPAPHSAAEAVSGVEGETPPEADAGTGGWAVEADEFSAAVSAVTTAFGDATRREIYLFVRQASSGDDVGDGPSTVERANPAGDGVTASEVAGAFSLHANVARHHLDKLAAGGYLVVDLARQETAGRPSKRYRAVAVESLLNFPPRRDALIGTLLARALERLDPDEARVMAEEVGYEYGVQLAARMSPTEGQRSRKAAMTAVAEALTAHGFAAHAEAQAGELTIVNESCAFGTAAQEYPHVLCSIDRGMIRGMLQGLYGDTEPEFTERRPEGDDHCVATVR